MQELQQWWGYNQEHGWVVLDRSIPFNRPGVKVDLFFLRCKDLTTFSTKREKWNPPSYIFGPNYIRGLGEQESGDAAAELEGFQSRWPELQEEIKRQYNATIPQPEAAAPEAAAVKKPRKSKKAAAPAAET
jgi:hypothetical protein